MNDFVGKLLTANNLCGAIVVGALPVAIAAGTDSKTQYIAFALVLVFGLAFVFTTTAKSEAITTTDIAKLPSETPITKEMLVKADPTSAMKQDVIPTDLTTDRPPGNF